MLTGNSPVSRGASGSIVIRECQGTVYIAEGKIYLVDDEGIEGQNLNCDIVCAVSDQSLLTPRLLWPRLRGAE